MCFTVMLLVFLYNEVILLTLNLSNVWTVNNARKEQYHDPNVTEINKEQRLCISSSFQKSVMHFALLGPGYFCLLLDHGDNCESVQG